MFVIDIWLTLLIWCIVQNSSPAFTLFFFFKQKTAYEMRISDWSSDVCSSDLRESHRLAEQRARADPGAVDAFVAFRPDAPHQVEILQLIMDGIEIGRASCRERVCQYV